MTTLVAAPGPSEQKAPLMARGASKVSGTVTLEAAETTVTARAELRGLNPGSYEVLFLPKCPPTPRPADLETGRVPVDRRAGLARKSIEGPSVRAGSFIAGDREEASFRVGVGRSAVNDWARFAVALREVDVNPPLSGPYGLIACTTFVAPQ